MRPRSGGAFLLLGLRIRGRGAGRIRLGRAREAALPACGSRDAGNTRGGFATLHLAAVRRRDHLIFETVVPKAGGRR